MQTKKHYQRYWSGKTKRESFIDYERNWVLPKIFDKKEKILDLGCGDGAVAEYLEKKLKNKVIGADISNKALKEANSRGIKTVLIDIEKKLPFKDGDFNSVFWGDNVEHLFNPQKTLSEINRVLTGSGRLILSCPNMSYWRYRMYYLLRGELPDTEWTGNSPWNWSHIRFFNLNILGDFLKSESFEITKVLGVNRRFPEKYFVAFNPSIFSMILIVEAQKK